MKQSDLFMLWSRQAYAPGLLWAIPVTEDFETVRACCTPDDIEVVLKDEKPVGGVLSDCQVTWITHRLESMVFARGRRELEASRQGLAHASACLSDGCEPFPEFEGACDKAAYQIAGWLRSYLEWPEPRIVHKSQVKLRNKPSTKHSGRLTHLKWAVEAATDKHPIWPVSVLGVVRLFPRCNHPLTCVAAQVTFSGRQPFVIAWPSET